MHLKIYYGQMHFELVMNGKTSENVPAGVIDCAILNSELGMQLYSSLMVESEG